MATKKNEKTTVNRKSPAGVSQSAGNNSQLQETGANGWKVRIRMYRKWLGDCFLLTFRGGEDVSHIMIDCGMMVGTPEGTKKITQVVEDIARETDGKLAALVVTHEHWDHVSGFLDAIDTFKKFTSINEVWAAWTEDPNQVIAKEKKKLNQLCFEAVQSALHGWSLSAGDDNRQRGAAVAALMEFMPPGGLAAFAASTDTAMNNALSLGKQRLLSPGETVELERVPGLRVHVLAPPKDPDALKIMIGEVGKDMYGLSAGSSRIARTEAFLMAAVGRINSEAVDRYAPFVDYLHWDEDAWAKQWSDLAGGYQADPSRRIDSDWLNSAADLALQLDNCTNNTSLVLAFELLESKDVLLFVGDAQIGNWQSWPSVKFSDPNVSAMDLLSRTIFYKVGHHGSHNATLKQGGLEAMTSSKLVAAIPVDEEFARRPKLGCPNGWNMPAGPLLASLVEKTSGRILRGDSDFPKGAARPAEMSEDDWDEFKQNTNIEEQFVEFFVR